MITRQFVKFVVAGGIAAVVNFGARIVLSHWMAYVPAIVIAYCIGMFTAFIINRRFVFAESRRPLHQQAWWFAAVNIAAVLQTVVISVLFDHWIFPAIGMRWQSEAVAHAIGLSVPVFTSFVGHKHLTFPGAAGLSMQKLADIGTLRKIRRLGIVVWLLVAAIAAMVFVYVWTTATPVVMSDTWYYADTLIKHYQEGTLGLTDIDGKRPGDNSQPLNRLILLALTRWSHLDLMLQGLVGVVIACLCVAFLSWLALRDWTADGESWPRVLLPLGFATILLSLNPVDLFIWPLVTPLTFSGSLGAIIYLYWVGNWGRRGTWVWVVLLALFFMVILDTFAILATMASVLLFIHRAFTERGKERRAQFVAALSAFMAIVLYQIAYEHVIGVQSTPLNAANIAASADYLASHWDELWKILVIPFALSIYAPLGHLGLFWGVLIPLALILWCGHLWFWREYFRNVDSRAAFLGAGLMLYFYATVAGILLDRVPQFGFDYLLQPRYIAFYELQLVALLLMASVVLQRRTAPRSMPAAVRLLICGMLLFNVYFAARAWAAAPSVRQYNKILVAQINALALDPMHPPSNCFPELPVCGWPLQQRLEVLQVLHDGRLNVFSPEFRHRHGYLWTEIPTPRRHPDRAPQAVRLR